MVTYFTTLNIISSGDTVYSHFFNQEIIVINSEKVATELLEKRSYNYSDRPKLPMNSLYKLYLSIFMVSDTKSVSD